MASSSAWAEAGMGDVHVWTLGLEGGEERRKTGQGETGPNWVRRLTGHWEESDSPMAWERAEDLSCAHLVLPTGRWGAMARVSQPSHGDPCRAGVSPVELPAGNPTPARCHDGNNTA